MHARVLLSVFCALILLAERSAAQDLDGVWLKARVAARLVYPDDSVEASLALTKKPKTLAVKRTVFFRLDGRPDNEASPVDFYDMVPWVLHKGELVKSTSSGSMLLIHKGIAPTFSFPISLGDEASPGFLNVIATGLVTAKTKPNGELKRVRARIHGARVSGALDVGAVVGAVRFRAKSVPESSLPPFAEP